MKNLAEVCQSEEICEEDSNGSYQQNYGNIREKQKENYSIFSEQYLEKPFISPENWLTLSATICTWRGVPTIDDPDVD